MFKISGTTIATPTEYEVSIASIDKAERNANGTMIIENIATKRKLSLSWDIIEKDDLQEIMNLLNASRFVEVEYLDPDTQTLVTKTFYSGDRGVGATTLYNAVTGLPYWAGFSVNLIEQ